MPQNVKGTFTGGPGAGPNCLSDTLVIPSGTTTVRLNLTGTTGSVKTQRSFDSGQTWADRSTYAAPQVNTVIAVAHGEQWRLSVVGTPAREIHYSLSAES